MKIEEFKFAPDNHFIAMEYYRLILNRTFLVLIARNHLIGIKVHGLVGVESYSLDGLLLPLHVDGDLLNPYSYMNPKYLKRIQNVDLLSESFLKISSANFIIKRSDIASVKYDPGKKWGMGYYPHDGKVYVTNNKNGDEREFIILGTQSGLEIQKALRQSSS
jgi:hypothetical protein